MIDVFLSLSLSLPRFLKKKIIKIIGTRLLKMTRAHSISHPPFLSKCYLSSLKLISM